MSRDAGITLLLGPPNSGKLGAVLEWWRDNRERQPLIVVPSQGDVTQITLELVDRVGGVTGGRPAATFPGLISTILGRPLALPSRPGRALLLRRLLNQLTLPALGPLAPLPGTPSALEQVLRELDESGLVPDEVLRCLERWREAGGGDLAADLASLYGAYGEACRERGLGDMGSWTLLAAQQASGWRRPVACYGFTSFAPVQRLLLQRLGEQASLLLAFIQDDGGAVGRLSGEELARWLPLAGEIFRLKPQSRVYSSPSIAFLAQSFAAPLEGEAAPSAQPVHPPADHARAPLATPSAEAEGDLAGVRFLVASGRRNEIELAGREIVRLLHAGISPGEIAVLVRRLGPWAPLIGQVFGAYGIPFRLDHRVPWGNTGLGHAFLQGLRSLLRPDPKEILSFLRSPYGGGQPSRADMAEVKLHRRGHRADAAAALLLRWFPEQLRRHGRLVGGSPPEGGFREEFTGLAEQLLQAAAQAGVLHPARLEEDARALGVLQRLAPELDEALRQGTSWQQVLAVLQASPVSLSREDDTGVVHVLSVARARPRRFPVVFLLGLVDGEFPAEEPSRGLLTAGQRQAANRAAGRALFQSAEDSRDEAFFALALTRPWQMLYLSTRDAEDEGGEVPPSPLWERARAALPDAPLLRRDLSEVVHPPQVTPSLREYLRYCAATRSLPPDAEQQALLAGLPAWKRSAALTLPGIRRELAARTVFSAGQLERYARCPFSWFLSDLVGLEEVEQELDALRLGALVHDVLAQTYLGLLTEGRLPLRAGSLARAEELLDHHLDKGLRALELYGTPSEHRLARQEVAVRLRRLLRFDARSGSRLVPRWLERRFGSGEGLDVGGLRLTGRLDRVDASPSGEQLLVIDYKNGSAVFGPSFAKDRALQVPLYIMALQALHPEASVIGGLYAALGAGTRGGMVLDSGAELVGGWRPGTPVPEERFRSELQACLGLAQEAARGIQDAAVLAAPPAGCPRYCDLRALCRGPLGRIEQGPSLVEPPAAEPLRVTSPVGRQLSLLEEGS